MHAVSEAEVRISREFLVLLNQNTQLSHLIQNFSCTAHSSHPDVKPEVHSWIYIQVSLRNGIWLLWKFRSMTTQIKHLKWYEAFVLNFFFPQHVLNQWGTNLPTIKLLIRFFWYTFWNMIKHSSGVDLNHVQWIRRGITRDAVRATGISICLGFQEVVHYSLHCGSTKHPHMTLLDDKKERWMNIDQ